MTYARPGYSFKIPSHTFQIMFHTFAVMIPHYVAKLRKLFHYPSELFSSVRIKQYLAQQIVILPHQPLGYTHVALESRAWSILMLHDRRKYKS